jgi:hypothetical protein
MPRSAKQKKKSKARKLNKARAVAEAVSISESGISLGEGSQEDIQPNTKESLGAIVRRHKQETKKLKVEIEVMTKERSKLDKRSQKEKRRQVTRDIRKLEAQLKQKHELELAQANALEGKQETDMAIEI